MKFYSVAIALIAFGYSVKTDARTNSRAEAEKEFLYSWSSEATLIFYGTVVALDYEDNPRERTPHVEVLVRISSLQRGVPGNHLVRVIIDDELQSTRWSGSEEKTGEHGIWFAHRLAQRQGAEPRGYLLRYIGSEEIEDDPEFLAELMKYVVEDTVDQAIQPNILNLLTIEPEGQEFAQVDFDLTYDASGALEDLAVVNRSENVLFNQHVYDALLQVHRRIRIPGNVRQTSISIERKRL